MRILVFFLFFITTNVFAITVDSLIKYQNPDQDNYYTVTNTDPFPVFVQTKLTELVRNDKGKSKEVALDPKDFNNWPVYLEPASIILDPKGEVKVNVVDLYKLMKKKLDKDRIIGVSFIPSSYKKKDAKGNTSDSEGSVNILMGYKSWYIIPKEGEIHGEASVDYKRNAKSYMINNTDTAVNFKINACDIKPKPEACEGDVLVLAHDKKVLKLPKGKGKVNISINSLNLKYSKNLTVNL